MLGTVRQILFSRDSKHQHFLTTSVSALEKLEIYGKSFPAGIYPAQVVFSEQPDAFGKELEILRNFFF